MASKINPLLAIFVVIALAVGTAIKAYYRDAIDLPEPAPNVCTIYTPLPCFSSTQ